MKPNDEKIDECFFQSNNQHIYYINSQKDSIMVHQSNGIITTLTKYQEYQTIEKKKIVELPQFFNTTILMDIISLISNEINCFESNLKMALISTKEQQLNNDSFQFQLVYALTYEYDVEIKEKEIDNSIIQISKNIIEILQETYNKGDQNLFNSINNLMEQHLQILE